MQIRENFIFSNIAQPRNICPSKYLGYTVAGEVSCRIAQASRAFGSPEFTASDLTLETKRTVYRSVVLGVLLYAETWAPPPKSWLLSWTGFTGDVYIAFWVLVELYNGRSTRGGQYTDF